MIIPTVPLTVLVRVAAADGRPEYVREFAVIGLHPDTHEPFVAAGQAGIGLASTHGEIVSIFASREASLVVQLIPPTGSYVAVCEVVDGLFDTLPVVGGFLRADGAVEPAIPGPNGMVISAWDDEQPEWTIVPLCSDHPDTTDAKLYDGRKIRVTGDGDGGQPVVTLI